ncbi:MAG TPA: hypothetical protein VFX03_16020, partial [Thermomicrobiales bacterium]|nr:hypothetical protein [Thermomicrobiales bacterium]
PSSIESAIGTPVDLALTSLAVAGGGSSGGSAFAGSVGINIFDTSTHATIDRGSSVTSGSLAVTATDTISVKSVAGSVGVGLGGTGVGAGLDLGIFTTDTRAYIGRTAEVTTTGAVSVHATGTETVLSVSANLGVGDSAGIAGSVSVEVFDTGTRAYVEDASSSLTAASIDAGSVDIDAGGDATVTMVAGSIGAGSSTGVGGAITTLVHIDTVEAYIGDHAVVTSDGTIGVDAHSTETIIGIAAAAGVGGSNAVAGSGTINILHETTRASVGRSAHVDVTAAGDLNVHASDITKIVSVAGSIAASGGNGVGIGADVGVSTKATDAYIESNVTSTVHGNIDVKATSSERITSVAVGLAAGSSVGVAIDASVHVLNVDTRAFIGDDPDVNGDDSAGAGDVHATGSVGIWADEKTEADKVIPTVSVGGTAAVTAAAGVTVINKHTYAFIGKGAKVTGDGNADIASTTGGFALTITSETPSNPGIEAESYSGQSADSLAAAGEVHTPQVDNASGKNTSDTDHPRPGNPGTTADGLGNAVSVAPASQSVRGVSVAATNRDDIESYSVGVAVGGTAAVAVAASVNVVTTDTQAYVADGAHVNESTAGADSLQDVHVVAGNDFRHIAASVGVAASGTAAVAPGVDVTVLSNTTTASIDANAHVNAKRDVVVAANASEDIILVGAGVAGGTVGVGGAVSVLVVDNHTTAEIAGAVTAGGNVLIAADDSTHVVAVDGAAGFGLGGVGASVGVISIGKDTQAFVADDASVDAYGNSSDTLDTLAGTFTGGNNNSTSAMDHVSIHGLAVQATSSETIFHLAVAAGGGAVGVAGGILVTSVSSSTHAYIGDADINQTDNSTNGNTAQSVYVSAANQADITTFAGAIAGGLGALAGGVDIGSLRNNTNAEIKSNAVVSAKHDVNVNALGLKELHGITVSGAGGVVGLAGAVSVWSIGQSIDDNYQGDGASSDPGDGGGSGNALHSSSGNADDDATGRGQDASDDVVSAFGTGNTGAKNPDTASNPGDRTSAIVYQGLHGTGGFADHRPDALALKGALTGPSVGTNAAIGGSAQVTAGGHIDVNAAENLQVTLTQGGVALGLAGVGAGIGILNIASNVSATAGGTLSAGAEIAPHASLYENVDDVSFAGAAGLVGLGAAVVVVNDSSTVTAGISDGATIHNASTIDVLAISDQHFSALTVGIAIGGVAGGASFTRINVDNGSAT